VLQRTIAGLPGALAKAVLVVDDGSTDGTAEVARAAGARVVRHEVNRGYGGAQKSGYRTALDGGAQIVVMVHGDDQYDPSLAARFAEKVAEGFDVVTGTRMVTGDAVGVMPWWKLLANRFLTGLENIAFGLSLTDFHDGYRAYSARFLETLPLDAMSDGFHFDSEILVLAALRDARVAEIPHETRYRDENSQMPFRVGVAYGLRILGLVARYTAHRTGLWRQEFFRLPARDA
jgi:glycosyltransferase involved in cell wall biosynthesis